MREKSELKVIDVQSHIITSSYMDFLLKNSKNPRIQEGLSKYFLWYAHDLKYSIDERMFSTDVKLESMKRAGIDMQILSIAMPGVDFLDPENGLDLAKKINDEISEIVDRYPNAFLGLATLPLQSVGEAVDELERAVKDLDLRGVEVFSNVAGKTLDDESFIPFYEKVVQLDVPIFLHPTKPLMSDAMKKYGLLGSVGYLFDTTLAILEIVLGGVLEKYKRLKIILPHCGSTIPYLIGRIDHQFNMNEESREKISRLPSEYLKLVYFDTAQAFHKPAFDCCFAFSGKDKLMFGTDYPFADLSKSREFLESIIEDKSKEDIFHLNAEQLFKIT
jgi:aminocarboxymuconate-semialdehyde decarboxylase